MTRLVSFKALHYRIVLLRCIFWVCRIIVFASFFFLLFLRPLQRMYLFI